MAVFAGFGQPGSRVDQDKFATEAVGTGFWHGQEYVGRISDVNLRLCCTMCEALL